MLLFSLIWLLCTWGRAWLGGGPIVRKFGTGVQGILNGDHHRSIAAAGTETGVIPGCPW